MPSALARRPRSRIPCLLVAALALACGGADDAERESRSSAGGKPVAGLGAGDAATLLLVTLDTTRADRLGCYGRPAAGTPVLDALARSGVRFDAAHSVAPLTLPAHSSLLTGLVPPVHGVRDNGAFGLPASAETLAERLRAEGHATGAFVAAYPLKATYGLAQGFDVYDDRFERKAAEAAFAERPAEQVVDAALQWLATLAPGDAAFAWVHLFDPHRPWPAGDDPYQAEIRRVDRELGRLLDGLDALGRGARRVVVVADHGEGLGQHGEQSHAQLVYQSTLRVPLLMSGPGFPAGRVVDTPVSVVDVLPTLLGVLDLPAPDGLQGRDLAPAWEPGGLSPTPIYAESLYPELHHGWSRLSVWIDAHEKLILAPAAGERTELFDLRVDPDETHDLAPERGARAQRLADDLRRWLDALPAPLEGEVARAQDDEALRQLAALGYLAPAPSPEEQGRHPADMIALVDALEEGRAAARAGRLGRARSLLAQIEAREPGGLPALELAADIALVLGQEDRAALERAATLYAEATTRAPQNRGLWRTLSEVEARLGRPLAALLSLERLFAVSEPTPKLRARHAELLERLRTEATRLQAAGERAASREHWRALLERRPEDAEAAAALAGLADGG